MQKVVQILLIAALLPVGAGCVTVAEHRKLEKAVVDMQRQRGSSQARQQLADLGADVEALQAQLRELNGRLEEIAQNADKGLQEARKARREVAAAAISNGSQPGLATGSAAEHAKPAESSAPTAPGGLIVAAGPTPGPEDEDSGDLSDEVQAYKHSLAAWRENDYPSCIDRFRSFLQTYASSSRADDAAFWIGDCHYRQGEFKNAVVRFDDVVRNYPTGNRAPDALYRQGESLLKLGPTFHPAAVRAFERVVSEYPDSARAAEATQQLGIYGPG